MGNEHSTNTEPIQNGKIAEKHENGSVNGLSAKITSNGLEIDVKSETTVHQNGEPRSLDVAIEPSEYVIIESDCQTDSAPVVSEIPDTVTQKEEVKKSKEAKMNFFNKMFKQNAEPPVDVESVKEKGTSGEDQTDVSLPPADPQQETTNLKQESEPLTEPESVTPDSGPEEEQVPETDNGNRQPVESQEESNPEENPVMNFFKTLVTTTKTSTKETATPDATKDQSQKETLPAATTTVAQISEPPAAPKGMSIPPPPPPEPPKMEIKGEPTAKPVKSVPKEEPKAAAKQPESSKGKSAKDTLSKFFRPKVLLGVKISKGKGASASGASALAKTAAVGKPVEIPEPAVEVQIENKVEPQEPAAEVAQPVLEVQMVDGAHQPVVEAEVDPSKSGTLEAAAKPEPPPPVQEEKKKASKSTFFSLLKPKELLDHMTTKVQAASTSGVRLLRKTTGLAAEPKKATPTPPAAAEATQAVKAKEEPKAAAKPSEAVVDNKPALVASQAGDDAANVPKRLEKRNSIQLFFKNLGQKRHSTDAGVQTEPVTVAPAAEKAK
ncbi:breast carcinoma-amplified sequence 1 isoform X2 [Stegastes partitus]|uniref:Breast carcinoma-amplified sequence 1 isoform X2 n=1 Tax=Stegastes partitus TaxID=144197 RepID=A0A9Y4N5N0_9TELE|nr:PREDICTED: breast carcinoma-amplified sequence 1 isoform X2 [Stegastes partitus]